MRNQIDDSTDYVKIYGAKGLAYIKINKRSLGMEGLQSPILTFLPADTVNVILDRLSVQDGDIVFFCADTYKIASESLAALKTKVVEV